MARCPFCEIGSGEAPASIVYQDARVMAFMDLRPANAGHVLVIPRKHWETIHEIPDSTLVDVFRSTKVESGISCMVSQCFLGMTRTWPALAGRRSMKAITLASW